MAMISGCSSGLQPSRSSVRPRRPASVNLSSAALPTVGERESQSDATAPLLDHAGGQQPVDSGLDQIGAHLQTPGHLVHRACRLVGQPVEQPARTRVAGQRPPAGRACGRARPGFRGRTAASASSISSRDVRWSGNPVDLADVDGLDRLAQLHLREKAAQEKCQKGDRHRHQEDDLNRMRYRVDVLRVEEQPRSGCLQLGDHTRIDRLWVELLQHRCRDLGQGGSDRVVQDDGVNGAEDGRPNEPPIMRKNTELLVATPRSS